MIRNRGTAALALAASLAALAPGARPASAVAKVYRFVAITKTNALIHFASDAPGKITSRVQCPGGHATADEIWALAARQSTRELYSFGQTFKLTKLDPATGAILWEGPNVAVIDTPLLYGGRVAMDFEPVTEYVRLQFPSGMTIRLDPTTGASIDADPAKSAVQPDHDRIAFLAGDARAAETYVAPIGIAYDRSSANAPAYMIHGHNGTALVRVDSYGSPRSSDAVATTVGEMNIGGGTGDCLDLLEIAGDGAAWLITQRINRPGAYLASVDLSTGRFSPSEIWPSAPDTGTDILTDENLRAFCVDPQPLAAPTPPSGGLPPLPGTPPLPPTNGPPSMPPGDPNDPPPAPPPFGPPPSLGGVTLSVDTKAPGNDTIRLAGSVAFAGGTLEGQVVGIRVGDQRKAFVVGDRLVVRSGDSVIRLGRPRNGRVAFRVAIGRSDVASDVERLASDDAERLRVGVEIGGTTHQVDVDLDVRDVGRRHRVARPPRR